MKKEGAQLRPAGPADAAAVESLLARLQLPTVGARDWIRSFWVAEAEGRLVGVAGVELYGDGALLRSVAVDPGWRSSGLGRTLVEKALNTAQTAGAREMFLLTTTAERYFPRLGFEGIPRASVPPGVQTSVEFTGACPDSAIAMRKSLA